ncbi:MAG: putative glycolipid-binding domain-containing protein [Gemmatimonadaceae bacterium]|nr:putative glycolipid-binding domain-containing protein [Gemmatimonadaceae bacterium]
MKPARGAGVDQYESILWKRLDAPGHEIGELRQTANGWQLRGAAVFAHAGQPCRLEYDIRCDPDWRTELVTVIGNVGDTDVAIELLRNPAGEWAVRGSKVWELTDCDDVDLNFSPSTNTLPVRRLALAVGESARVRAAWVRFPEFNIEPLEQVYTRTGAETYRYESANGKFRRELTVDTAGFVIEYPDFWRAEARSRPSNG